MSTPKLFGSVIVSRKNAKTLMQIAEELDAKDKAEQDTMTKSASAQPKKEVTASAEEPKEEPKVEETASTEESKEVEASAEETASTEEPKETEETLEVTASDEIKEENAEESSEGNAEEAPVKEASKKFNFTKIAKLTDKDRSYLKKYYEEYYPADYVDALLADY